MLGRTRIHTRARGSGAGAGSTTTTDLQRILALSPSLLIWPANGAGWQGTSGGTLAASGQPLGLGADLSQLQGRTLSEWLATAPELVTNGTGTNVAGWNLSTGTLTSVGGRLRFSVSTTGYATRSFTTVVGRTYLLSGNCARISGTANFYGVRKADDAGASINVVTGTNGTVVGEASSAPNPTMFVATATTTFVILQLNAVDASVADFSNISIKELPGNHLRAGTWASPSDAARGTFQNNAINFDGASDYYSLLNAISITESMTVVRAFKRASAGINSTGIGDPAGSTAHDAAWLASDNRTYCRLHDGGVSASSASGSTATGSFVDTSRRAGLSQNVRRNGVEILTGAAIAATGNFETVGRISNTFYNSGEISFLAVFPSELTGANLALVEQIAASTNSATLA